MNLYCHLPFCLKKCAYCAFYSETGVADDLQERYCARLVEELKREEKEIESVYLGGGTPTLLSPRRLEMLGQAIRSLPLAPGAEISCESNPETLTREKTEILRSFVTRISIGIQSFSGERRATIGRQCSDSAIEKAIAAIRDAKFPHANADLIYAIPGETPEDFADDLARLLHSNVFDHFSAYNLTLEEGTRLAREKPQIDEDAALEMYQAAENIASAHGFEHYEISNYAKNGAQCRHNVAVWRGDPYRGIGAGAAGFDGRDRCIQVESIADYLAGTPPVYDRISPEARACEIAAINLRTAHGWTENDWNRRISAISWPGILEKIAAASKVSGVTVEFGKNSVRLPPESLLFWNSFAEELLCDEQPD